MKLPGRKRVAEGRVGVLGRQSHQHHLPRLVSSGRQRQLKGRRGVVVDDGGRCGQRGGLTARGADAQARAQHLSERHAVARKVLRVAVHIPGLVGHQIGQRELQRRSLWGAHDTGRCGALDGRLIQQDRPRGQGGTVDPSGPVDADQYRQRGAASAASERHHKLWVERHDTQCAAEHIVAPSGGAAALAAGAYGRVVERRAGAHRRLLRRAAILVGPAVDAQRARLVIVARKDGPAAAAAHNGAGLGHDGAPSERCKDELHSVAIGARLEDTRGLLQLEVEPVVLEHEARDPTVGNGQHQGLGLIVLPGAAMRGVGPGPHALVDER